VDTILSGDLRNNDIPLPLESFFSCFTGPVMHLKTGCETFDFNSDTHIDDSDMTTLVNTHNYGENSHHVVTGSGTDSNAVIDGFTIIGGNAGPYFPDEPMPYEPKGGGMYNYSGSPEVLNCTFSGNLAGDGGGMYNTNSNPRLLNCTFYKNVAREITIKGGDAIPLYYGHGGALYNNGSSPSIIGCRFSGNLAYSGGGIMNHAGSPVLTNCIFEGNYAESAGGGICKYYNSNPILKNCILWGNTIFWGNKSSQISGSANVSYSDIQSGWPGEGNINNDPLFADPNKGDYHLKSQAGRFNPNTQSWVQDDVTSPCIDTGDPMSPIGYEPFPNGGIINMGAYGGTAEASKSYFGESVCETIVAGDINGDCKVDLKDFVIMVSHWLEQH
jgi:parallel beta-helix repeat protein